MWQPVSMVSHIVNGVFLVGYCLYFWVYMLLLRWLSVFILCSCVQIRNWFDYRNHICIVSTESISATWFPQLYNFLGIKTCQWIEMMSTGLWEAWTKLIRFSSEKQLPLLSGWSSPRDWQTIVGMCSMCVVNTSALRLSFSNMIHLFQ